MPSEPCCPSCKSENLKTKDIARGHHMVTVLYCEDCGHVLAALPIPSERR